MSDTPLTDAVLLANMSKPDQEQFGYMDLHARRLERALRVAEERAAKFVRRVEAGEVMSKQTYADMKEVIATIAKLKEGA